MTQAKNIFQRLFGGVLIVFVGMDIFGRSICDGVSGLQHGITLYPLGCILTSPEK